MLSEKIKVARNNGIIQFLTRQEIYVTEDHLIFKSSDLGKTWTEICRILPDNCQVMGRIKDRILRSKLVRRFRNNIGIHNVVVLPSGTIIIQYDKIYRYCGKGKYALPVFDLQRECINGPLKNGLCHDPCTGYVYFGEYIIKRPSAVKIFRGIDDGRNWDICYQFPPGQVRHIHSIFADPIRKGRLWVCTGDNDQESGLYFTDDDFRNVHLFGGGDQGWRMVSLLFVGKDIFWGSDAGQDASPEDKNYIYRLNVETGRRERLCCIDKPAYYSVKMPDGTLYIATSFEPKIKRDVTRSADLWRSIDGSSWKMVCSFPYLSVPRKTGTRYGTIFLPRVDNWQSEQLFMSPVNVAQLDFTVTSLTG